MKKLKTPKTSTRMAIFAGATALMTLASQSHAQSSDALLDKLVDKGILTTKEAQELREESDKGFTTAFQAKTGMPDWVTGYKFSGDFRGRYEQFNVLDNDTSINRTRYRYRLRVGVVANMLDNIDVGLRLTSGDSPKGYSTGNPVSGNTTMQDNGTKKGIFIDTAYAKWTPLNSGDWLLATTIGKMDNPFLFTDMIFDADYTPEGGAITGGYTFNDRHALAFTGGAFVLDELSSSTRDPYMVGGQVFLNSTWSPKLATSVGVAALQIGNAVQLTTANVPYINQGNTRSASGVLLQNYNPIIGDASATYTLDNFSLYSGAFPIKVGGEYINNPAVDSNNQGFFAGVTFGKSGRKRTWDLTYRYLYLESDAWYDQVVSDDNTVYYQNVPSGGVAGMISGTNIKGHLARLNYSLNDFVTLSLTGYLTELIHRTVNNNVSEPGSQTLHVQADVSVKF